MPKWFHVMIVHIVIQMSRCCARCSLLRKNNRALQAKKRDLPSKPRSWVLFNDCLRPREVK